ncbi:hypothetical protein GCM10011391_39970 [Pullulanibacillus camelliae]|uniref:RNase H type-1 domain-containing protein n=1 Tax=Pullulanibacillus camelliae TaxID=1707096 RepID=A0A8J2YNT8_9BACL|nr:reverse transcriptase-like protein [Pullulanibacillus camelliae]GGE57078.1 hypothetical protein GCM10011391_39970 [Pullulanibacillus camelliae]
MDVRMLLIYKTRQGLEVGLNSDELSAEKALLIAEDLERTGRIKQLELIDQQERMWNVKTLKRFIEDIQGEPHNITLYFDGGFNEETKTSGLACVIYYEQNGRAFRLRKNAKATNLLTNNEAEYAALDLALRALEQLGVHHLQVKIKGDSQVVINQLLGEWPCFEKALNQWADRIEAKLAGLGLTPDYQLISRKLNQEADHLATQALQSIDISSTIELNQGRD